MAKIYATLVREGKWKLEKVPERWRDEVRRMLEEDAKDGDAP